MMKRVFSSMASLLVMTMLVVSCQHDPVVIITPPIDGDGTGGDTSQVGNSCNPDSVYFEKDVLPILATNCALSGCHDAQTHKEGVALIDYSRTISTGRVKAFKPNESKLYRSLFEDGEDRMPPPPRSLSSDQIGIIRKWIEQGALNLMCNPDAAGCESTAVTYAGFIQPLIASRCQGCHSNASTGGGILITNYDQVKTIALNGTFYGSVSRAQGYSAMPKVGSALTSCELEKVKAWIDDGAKQN